MTELTCWPLDNKEYTAEALGAAYAARSRGILHAADFTATANGDNTLTIGPGVGCIHPGTYWAAFPYLLANTQLTFYGRGRHKPALGCRCPDLRQEHQHGRAGGAHGHGLGLPCPAGAAPG